MKAHRGLLRVVCALAAMAIATAALPARAQGPLFPSAPARPRVAIAYAREKGAEKCPDAARVRETIVGSVGSAVEIVDGAEAAPEKIEVTIARKRGRFVGAWKRAGAGAAERVLEDADCARLIENVAESIVVAIEPPPASAAPKAIAPAAAPAPVTPPGAAPSSTPARKPGAFEGTAGAVRGVLLALAGAAITTGAGFAAGAAVKLGAARALQADLAPNACSGATAGNCGRLASLLGERDAYANAAVGLVVAGGITAGAALVSIWIVRTPARDVRLTPTAPGALAALTLRGSW
jgi:hypothetical protein